MSLSRMIVPIVSPQERALAEAAPAAAAKFTYRNGPLLTAVEVHTIFWGAAWQQWPQNGLATELNRFFDFILTSSLMDVLAEYSVPGKVIRHGRRIGTITIADSEPGGSSQTVSDDQIQSALKDWLQQGRIPAVTSNTLYFVFLPPGVTSTQGGGKSCGTGSNDYCGYHNHIDSKIFYAVEPYATCSGCAFGNGIADTLTKVSSHELCEAITDPVPGQGWYDDSNGEIGDICNLSTTKLGGFIVQREWSNGANACILDITGRLVWHDWQNAASGSQNWHGLERIFDAAGVAQVVVGRNADGRLEVFALDAAAGLIWHNWQNSPSGSQDWHGWEQLGAAVGLGQIAVANNADGRLELFAWDNQTGLAWHVWQNSASGSQDWSGWERLFDAVGLGQVAVASNADGRLELFALDTSAGLAWHNWQNSPSGSQDWHGWERLFDAAGLGRIEVANNADGRLELFALDTSAGLAWHVWQNSASGSQDWSGWERLFDAAGLGQIAVASNADGRLELFALDTTARLAWHVWQNSPSGSQDWSGWERLFDVVGLGQITVASNADGRLELFALDTSAGLIWHDWQNSPSGSQDWSGWERFGGGAGLGQIAVASNADGRLELFAIDFPLQ